MRYLALFLMLFALTASAQVRPAVGPLSVSTTGGTTTLYTQQVLFYKVIEITGTLTSNAIIALPNGTAWVGTLVNTTIGPYTVTFQTSGQAVAGTVVAQTGFVPAASDGTTLYSLGNSSNSWPGTQFFNNGIGVIGNLVLTGSMTVNNGIIQGPIYTISLLPTCNVGIVGASASVSNGVSSPTYFGAVSTTGTSTDPVYCNYNGSTYGWVYH